MSDKEAIHNEKLVQSLREWNDEKIEQISIQY